MIIQTGIDVVEWSYQLERRYKNEQSTTDRKGAVLH